MASQSNQLVISQAHTSNSHITSSSSSLNPDSLTFEEFNITDHFTGESDLYELRNSQVEEKLRKCKYCRLEKYCKMTTSSGNLESHIKSKHNINSKLGRKKLSKAEKAQINKNFLLFLIF